MFEFSNSTWELKLWDSKSILEVWNMTWEKPETCVWALEESLESLNMV
jgi:hypothetical protein